MTESQMNQSNIQGGPKGTGCDGVLYIPGIASNETALGLSEFFNRYSRVHGYIAVAVCLFGVLSNSANIVVLTRKNMISSTNIILLWLAVADLLTMLDYLPFAIHFYINKPDVVAMPPFSTPEFSWICFLLFHASFSIVCHTIAIWLTIALAIFRYIYICKPTRGSHYCSQKRACFVVVTVIILTIILCIPNYAVNTYDFQLGSSLTDTLDHNAGNSSVRTQVNKSNGSLYYPQIKLPVDSITNLVNSWVQAILIKLIPCFMLVTLTLLLLHAMHKAYRRRLKLKSQGRRAESDKHGEHNRTTGMLLAIVVLFTLTELPQGILTLMNIFVNCFTEVVYNKLGDLLDIMALINNSVNFVLYCTMSKQFRTTFAAIFCPPKSSRPKWLKLRLMNSHQGNKSSMEVVENAPCNAHVKNNCLITNNTKTDQMVSGSSENELSCKEMYLNNLREGAQSCHISNKLSPPLDTNMGISTHTHGYSPDHYHV